MQVIFFCDSDIDINSTTPDEVIALNRYFMTMGYKVASTDGPNLRFNKHAQTFCVPPRKHVSSTYGNVGKVEGLVKLRNYLNKNMDIIYTDCHIMQAENLTRRFFKVITLLKMKIRLNFGISPVVQLPKF